MTSLTLVALQLVAIGALAFELPKAEWSGATVLLEVIAVFVGVSAVVANPPGNFNIRPEPRSGGRLIRTGPYRWIRHPMYGALLLAAAGLVVAVGSMRAMALAGVLAMVLLVKLHLEERWMVQAHPDYEAYRRNTWRLLPGVW